MSCIFENLYLGDVDDAYSIHQKVKKLSQVTHVLTIDSKPLPIKKRDGLKYMSVHCLDADNYDLLSHIPKCIDFIDEGRNEGSVLVHSYFGQSRSGAIVVAYLMKSLDMNLSEAMEYARKMRPSVRPNEGFLMQLQIFEEMGNVVNFNSQTFKQYRTKLLSDQFQIAHSLDDMADNLADAPQASESKFTTYKCKKCRKLLFDQSNILSHSSEVVSSKPCTPSFVVEPLSWMKDAIQSCLSDKITCPSCKSKIGSFNWCGESCGCGQWVTPVFQLFHSRIDAVPCVRTK